MGVTNLDDLDLAQPGIEADEINTESAEIGRVLRSDGAGGASFERGGALLRLFHGSEDSISANVLNTVTDASVEFNDGGYTYNSVTGEVTIGSELAGRRVMVIGRAGVWAASQVGYFKVSLHCKIGGAGAYQYLGGSIVQVHTGDSMAVAVATTIYPVTAGDIWKVYTYLYGPAAGSAELMLDDGITEFLAI